MGLSNQDGHLVLATGNKTELAVGYSTLYGDSVGGFAPIKDVPKTLVWKLARWRNADADKRGETPPIPENTITKPPSAELRPGQLDTDSLPDVRRARRGAGRLRRPATSAGPTWSRPGTTRTLVERVIRLVDRAEYKRRQYPPGPKISLKAFGRDRRLPISSRWAETAPPEAVGPHHGASLGRAGRPARPHPLGSKVSSPSDYVSASPRGAQTQSERADVRPAPTSRHPASTPSGHVHRLAAAVTRGREPPDHVRLAARDRDLAHLDGA